MAYRMLAEAAMVIHFLFLAFLVGGGFAAWWWRRLMWPHLAAVCWGFAAVLGGLECPLTSLESWGRRMSGGQGLTMGFVDTYIEGVIYPESYAIIARVMVLAAVVASWSVFGLRLVARRRHSPGAAQDSRYSRL